MKKIMAMALGLLFAASMAGMAAAGSLDSPGSPSVGSGMYTLQNLYDYLTSGTALTAQSGFQEPTAAPGSTMKTTKEIGDGISVLFGQCPATIADVRQGVKFFSTVSGSWGVRTGTMQAPTQSVCGSQTGSSVTYSSCESHSEDMRGFSRYSGPQVVGYGAVWGGDVGTFCACMGHTGGVKSEISSNGCLYDPCTVYRLNSDCATTYTERRQNTPFTSQIECWE
ncbi:MAG: hypothetical protein NTZ78_01405 [Candidatus Aureabacteria bacterium]|nr:hypothetical protein [Candidatus Auribacterota bacterium]